MTDQTGAVLQRDGRRYAVSTRIPAGVVTPGELETIAAVARQYRVPILKITGGQRIVLAGIEPADCEKVTGALGRLAKPEAVPCVKYVQACLGTEMCRYGNQDAIGLARAIDERLQGMALPAKIKVGVSGCPRCCSASHTRDIGIMGTSRGWTVLFGGNGGTRPRFGDVIARNISAGDALDCTVRLAEYYKTHAKPRERTARFMERIGMETLKRDLLTFLPYVPAEGGA